MSNPLSLGDWPPLDAGRGPAGQALLDWVADPGAPRLCLVTGSEGAGKSHLLAWFTSRAAEHPAARVHALLPAAGLGLGPAVWELSHQLGWGTRSLTELLDHAALDDRPLLIAVPDLHLVSTTGRRSGARLVPDLLQPLLRLPWVRVLAEVRAPSDSGFTHDTAELVARHGNSGLVVLKSRSDRAQNLVYLGRYQEAERECQAVHALGRNIDGPHGLLLRGAVANAMAMALHFLDRHDEAEAAARAATEEMTRAGEAHLRMLRILQVNLARVLCARDRFDEAHRIVSGLECAVPTDRAALRSVSAVALLGLGRHEEAEAAAREAVTICEWGLSAVHHRALEAGTVLGSVLAAQGRLPEAERRLAANSAAWDEHFGPDHPRAVAARAALVDVRHRLGATQGSGPA